MAGKPNIVKTDIDLTAKQRKFVDIYVSNFGFISKTQAAKEGINPASKFNFHN